MFLLKYKTFYVFYSKSMFLQLCSEWPECDINYFTVPIKNTAYVRYDDLTANIIDLKQYIILHASTLAYLNNFV